MLTLTTKVTELYKVGKVLASRLKRLGIETTKDLIFYYPFRYDDFSQIVKISQLSPGMVATVKGRVAIIANRRSPRKRKILTEAMVNDESGEIKIIWFNQPWTAKNIKAGDELYFSGKVSGDLFNIYFNSPNYEKTASFNVNTARLVPVYPLTEGITQKQLRFLIKNSIYLADKIIDYLPLKIIKEQKLLALSLALKSIHFPKDWTALGRAKERLSFDELFLIQLWSQLARKKLERESAASIKFLEKETKEFVSRLNFELTSDQKKAAWEILRDLKKNRPMNRLLQGEVGSGKTLVAAFAIYNTVLNGYQSVLMAPTEILAYQHYETLLKLFKPFKIKVGLLTRARILVGGGKIKKSEFLTGIEKGEIKVIVGTHAVIQKSTSFADLALVIVDEQHRFGVEQRKRLKQKGKITPHLLSLTATPIPRSLALTLYGDLDLSIIREMPHGRKKILTKIVAPEKRQLAYNFISEQIKLGRQVFVICPLIDPSDKLGVRSVTQEFEKLDKQVFPHLKIGLLHGRLKTKEKEAVMKQFVSNEIKILVATSVVEVGVDVPNASVMMIEGAERFGLAQLHQFRGRVGRSHHQSFCFLFSDSSDLESLRRLEALVNCHDGFVLAQRDLEFRGAGKIYGYEQSGFSDLKIANLNDLRLVQKARQAAAQFIEEENLNRYPLLAAKMNSLSFSGHLE